MATYAITAANVVPSATATLYQGISGGVITAGDIVYLDQTTGQIKLANASTSAATSRVLGMALNSTAAAGQTVTVATAGDVTIASAPTLTAREVLVLSNTNGKGCDYADFKAAIGTWFPAVIGIAKSSTVLTIIAQSTGV